MMIKTWQQIKNIREIYEIYKQKILETHEETTLGIRRCIYLQPKIPITLNFGSRSIIYNSMARQMEVWLRGTQVSPRIGEYEASVEMSTNSIIEKDKQDGK